MCAVGCHDIDSRPLPLTYLCCARGSRLQEVNTQNGGPEIRSLHDEHGYMSPETIHFCIYFPVRTHLISISLLSPWSSSRARHYQWEITQLTDLPVAPGRFILFQTIFELFLASCEAESNPKYHWIHRSDQKITVTCCLSSHTMNLNCIPRIIHARVNECIKMLSVVKDSMIWPKLMLHLFLQWLLVAKIACVNCLYLNIMFYSSFAFDLVESWEKHFKSTRGISIRKLSINSVNNS